MSNDWSNGICGCFGDCGTCLLAWLCPCIQFGRNAESLGESCCTYAIASLIPLLGLYCRVVVRGRVREQKSIEGSCFKDLICVICCPLCSLVQEAQELQAPGGKSIVRE